MALSAAAQAALNGASKIDPGIEENQYRPNGTSPQMQEFERRVKFGDTGKRSDYEKSMATKDTLFGKDTAYAIQGHRKLYGKGGLAGFLEHPLQFGVDALSDLRLRTAATIMSSPLAPARVRDTWENIYNNPDFKYRDVLAKLYPGANSTTLGHMAISAGGLVGDVALDPLTYAGGIGLLGKTARSIGMGEKGIAATHGVIPGIIKPFMSNPAVAKAMTEGTGKVNPLLRSAGSALRWAEPFSATNETLGTAFRSDAMGRLGKAGEKVQGFYKNRDVTKGLMNTYNALLDESSVSTGLGNRQSLGLEKDLNKAAMEHARRVNGVTGRLLGSKKRDVYESAIKYSEDFASEYFDKPAEAMIKARQGVEDAFSLANAGKSRQAAIDEAVAKRRAPLGRAYETEHARVQAATDTVKPIFESNEGYLRSLRDERTSLREATDSVTLYAAGKANGRVSTLVRQAELARTRYVALSDQAEQMDSRAELLYNTLDGLAKEHAAGQAGAGARAWWEEGLTDGELAVRVKTTVRDQGAELRGYKNELKNLIIARGKVGNQMDEIGRVYGRLEGPAERAAAMGVDQNAVKQLRRLVEIDKEIARTQAKSLGLKSQLNRLGSQAEYFGVRAQRNSSEVAMRLERAMNTRELLKSKDYLAGHRANVLDAGRRAAALEQQRTVQGLVDQGWDIEKANGIYERIVAEDSKITQRLVDLGILDPETAAKWEGIHLRRLYGKFERPDDFVNFLRENSPHDAEKYASKLMARPGGKAKSLKPLYDLAPTAGRITRAQREAGVMSLRYAMAKELYPAMGIDSFRPVDRAIEEDAASRLNYFTRRRYDAFQERINSLTPTPFMDEAPGSTIDVVHYSNGKADFDTPLTRLDPSHQGEGQRGAEQILPEAKVTSYYVSGSGVAHEAYFNDSRAYWGTVNKDDLYRWTPQDAKKGTERFPEIMAEGKYRGIYFPDVEQVRLWDSQAVTYAGKAKAPAGQAIMFGNDWEKWLDPTTGPGYVHPTAAVPSTPLEKEFAALNTPGEGLSKFDARRGGLGFGNPGHYPDSTEAQVLSLLDSTRDAEGKSHVSAKAMLEIKGAPGSAMARAGKYYPGAPRSIDELRNDIIQNLTAKDWYKEFAEFFGGELGAKNFAEFRMVFGVTSQQSPPYTNAQATLRIMRYARELEAQAPGAWTGEDLMRLVNPEVWRKGQIAKHGAGDLAGKAAPSYKDLTKEQLARGNAWAEAHDLGSPLENPEDGGLNIGGAQVDKIARGYITGSTGSGNQKTPSYSGNLASALRNVYDPNSTNDTWIWKWLGYKSGRAKSGAKEASPFGDENTYRYAQGVLQGLGSELGMSTHQAQAAAWFAQKFREQGAAGLAEGSMPYMRDFIKTDLRNLIDSPVFQRDVPFSDAVSKLDFNYGGATLHGELVGKPTTRPISAEQRAAAAAAAEQQGPNLTVSFKPGTDSIAGVTREDFTGDPNAFHDAVLQSIGYDPETRQIKALTDMNIPHVVQSTTGVGVWDNTMEPNIRIALPGGNAESADFVAAHLGKSFDQDAVAVNLPSSTAATHKGLVLHHPGGQVWSKAELDTVGQAMAAKNIGFETSNDGTFLKIADYDGNGNQFVQDTVDALGGIGYGPEQLTAYAGDSYLVFRGDYDRILDGLGDRFGAAGSPGVLGGADSPLQTAYNDAVERFTGRPAPNAGADRLPDFIGEHPARHYEGQPQFEGALATAEASANKAMGLGLGDAPSGWSQAGAGSVAPRGLNDPRAFLNQTPERQAEVHSFIAKMLGGTPDEAGLRQTVADLPAGYEGLYTAPGPLNPNVGQATMDAGAKAGTWLHEAYHHVAETMVDPERLASVERAATRWLDSEPGMAWKISKAGYTEDVLPKEALAKLVTDFLETRAMPRTLPQAMKDWVMEMIEKVRSLFGAASTLDGVPQEVRQFAGEVANGTFGKASLEAGHPGINAGKSLAWGQQPADLAEYRSAPGIPGAIRKQRKDLDKETREALDEIMQAGPRILKGNALGTEAAARGQLFRRLNEEMGIDEEAAKELNLVKGGRRYRKIPGDPVPEGGRPTTKWGDLQGRWIDESVHKNLMYWYDATGDPTKAEAVYKKLLQSWKYGKTVMNPAGHMRNVMANYMRAWHETGLDPARFTYYMGKAIKEIKQDGPLWQEALESGAVFHNTYIGNEFQRSLKRYEPAYNIWDNIKAGWRWTNNKMGDLYQGEEEVGKLAVYLFSKDQGMDSLAAAGAAERTLFNYSKVSPLVDKARTWGAVPFASYPSFALPAEARNFMEHPERYAAEFKAYRAIESADRSMSDGERQHEKDTLPGYMNPLLSLRTPGKDANGQSRYLDLSYIAPFGQFVGEPGSEDTVGGTANSLVGMTNPLLKLAYEIGTNRSQFSGRPVTNELSQGGRISDYARYAATAAVPPLAGIPGVKSLEIGTGSQTIGNALRGVVDRNGENPKALIPALASSLAGLKTTGATQGSNTDYWYAEMDRLYARADKLMDTAYGDELAGKLTSEELDQRMEEINADLEARLQAIESKTQ